MTDSVAPVVRAVPLRAVDQPGGVDDFEVAPGDDVELVQDVVVEARVARAADVPGRAVVGQDHPVALEGLGDRRGRAGRSRDMSYDALSRTRRPIGGSDVEVESLAWWRAG